MNTTSPARTVTVEIRPRYRYPRFKLRYPASHFPPRRLRRHWLSPAFPSVLAPPGPRPPYDTPLAMELLASTAEPPTTRYDLLCLHYEYRRALHALATQARPAPPA